MSLQRRTELHHGVGDLAAPERHQPLIQAARTPTRAQRILTFLGSIITGGCVPCRGVTHLPTPPSEMILGMPSVRPLAKPGTVCTFTYNYARSVVINRCDSISSRPKGTPFPPLGASL